MQIRDARQSLGNGTRPIRESHERRSARQPTIHKRAIRRPRRGRRDCDRRARREHRRGRRTGCHGEGGEGRDGEVRARGAGGDEAGREGKDGADAEGRVECRGDGGRLGRGPDEGLMAGFDSQDLRRDGEDPGRLDERSRREVGAHSDVLENPGRGDHGLGGREAEVIGAWHDGLRSGAGDGGCEGRDVGRFCALDGVQVRNISCGETESCEVCVGELGEALLVEGSFEVL